MGKFDSHPSRDQLAAFDSGALAALQWEAVEGHIAICDECYRQLETLPIDELSRRIREIGANSGPDVGFGVEDGAVARRKILAAVEQGRQGGGGGGSPLRFLVRQRPVNAAGLTGEL